MPALVKNCKSCEIEKSLADFHNDKRAKDGKQSNCKTCANAKSSDWAKNNIERHKLKCATYYKDNKEKLDLLNKNWVADNSERRKQICKNYSLRNSDAIASVGKNWASANRVRLRIRDASRRALKVKSTPIWANEIEIKNVYEKAAELTRDSGIKHEVDHIVPLKSKLVCGLHNEFNLQALTLKANRSKHNRHWPNMPN